MFLLDKSLFTLSVELADRVKIVVRAAIALDVDAHRLEHFERVTVAAYLEHLCLVLLEEPDERKLVLSLLQGVAKMGVVVRSNEQTHVVGLMVLQKAALQRSVIPLDVVLSAQLGGALPQIVVAAAEQDDRVRVDVLLEFGLLRLFD